VPGSLRLASLLGTQLLVPPSAGFRRSYKASCTAQRPRRACRPVTIHFGPVPRREVAAVRSARPSGETKWPVLCSRGASYRWGQWKAHNADGPCRVATIDVRRQRRRKSSFSWE
jgi:hypothetical protein